MYEENVLYTPIDLTRSRDAASQLEEKAIKAEEEAKNLAQKKEELENERQKAKAEAEAQKQQNQEMVKRVYSHTLLCTHLYPICL